MKVRYRTRKPTRIKTYGFRTLRIPYIRDNDFNTIQDTYWYVPELDVWQLDEDIKRPHKGFKSYYRFNSVSLKTILRYCRKISNYLPKGTIIEVDHIYCNRLVTITL